ncbi:MAG TPA: exonuclease domain-containing protein, partial [Rubrobacter sp.]|nr:exonuclease domain-containing protein [Rubrobacter sp.]
MSTSLYGFVKDHEPVSPEEISTGFLSLTSPNGDARALVERLVGGDSRFVWEGEDLRTAPAASLALGEAPYVVFDVETTGSAAGKGGAITEIGALKLVRGEVVDQFSTLVNPGRPIDPFVVRLTGIT